MYMLSTFHNGFMSFLLHLLHIYTSYIYIYMLSSLVKEATTFEMELRGHKKATAHSHEHTKKFESFKKNFSRRRNSNSNLLIIPKPPEIVRIYFRANGIHCRTKRCARRVPYRPQEPRSTFTLTDCVSFQNASVDWQECVSTVKPRRS